MDGQSMKNKKGVSINHLCNQFTEMLTNIYLLNNPYAVITSETTLYEDSLNINPVGYQLIGHYGVRTESNGIKPFDIEIRFLIPYPNYNEEFIKGVFYHFIITNETIRRNNMGQLNEDDLDKGDYDDEDSKLVC